MKILFIHSAGIQNETEGSLLLVRQLQSILPESWQMQAPAMPRPEKPNYGHWIETIIAHHQGVSTLIGHSLGASILLKMLSEGLLPSPAGGLFMIAAPFWGLEEKWHQDRFKLQPNFADHLPPQMPIHLYHSQDDTAVAYAHALAYMQAIPTAILRTQTQGGHLFQAGLPDLMTDLQTLTSPKSR